MSTSLADLTVQISTDIASLNDGMSRAADVVSSTGAQMSTAFDGINASIDAASAALKDLAAIAGVGLSVGGIVAYGESIASAAENLHNLSAVTGSSVESLSMLANAAKIAGVDTDTFSSMLERMSSNMMTVNATSTKAQQALQALGVSATDPAEALQEVAVALDQYADGAGKAAVARDLFGRGGPAMVSALHDMATATSALTTTTTDDADAAVALAEQTRLLGIQMTTFKDSVLRDVIPTITAWITNTQAARAAGLGWFDALSVGTTYASRIGPALDDARAKLDALTAAQTAAAQSWNAQQAIQNGTTYINQYSAAVDQATMKLNALKSAELQMAQALISPSNMDARDLALQNMTQAPQLQYTAPAAPAPNIQPQIDAMTESYDKLQNQLDGVTESYENTNKVFDEYNRAVQAGGPINLAQWDQLGKIAAQTDAAANSLKLYTAGMQASSAAVKELTTDTTAETTAVTAYNDKIADQISKYADEAAATTLSATALKALAASRQIDIDLRTVQAKLTQENADLDKVEAVAIATGNEALMAYVDAERAKIAEDSASAASSAQAAKDIISANLEAQDTFAAGWTKAWTAFDDGATGAKAAGDLFNSVTQDMETALVNFTTQGASSFKTFVNSLLSTIEQFLAKQAVVSFFGLFSGTAGASGLSSLFGAGTSTVSGPASSGGSGAGSIFGSLFGDLPSLGTALSNVEGGFSTFTTLLDGGSGIIDSLSAATAGLGSSFAALLGPIGLFAGIAIPLLSNLFKSGGGPKVGGSAGVVNFYPDEQTAANDATIQATVTSMGAAFAQMLQQLGGSGAAQFALGFDTDPQGKAGNRVSALANVNGQNAYLAQDVGAGSDAAGLQSALADQAARAVLAALEASNLPTDIASLFDSINLNTASAADITAIEQVAATYASINKAIEGLPSDVGAKFVSMLDGTQDTANAVLALVSVVETFGDAVSGLGPQIEALDPASLTAFVAALGGASAMASSFSYLAANFTTSAQQMQLATTKLDSDFNSLGITTIPQTHQAFLDLLSSFDLTTTAGQQLYASVLGLSQEFVSVHGTADAAAQALDQQAQATQQLVDSATQFFDQNFYSASEQSAKQYQADLASINAAQAQLGVNIPETVSGFRQLIEGIDQTTPAGAALYASLIVLAPAIFDVSGAAGQLAANASAAASAVQQLNTNYTGAGILDTVQTTLQQFASVSQDIPNSSVGDQLSEQITLIQQKIASVQAGVDAGVSIIFGGVDVYAAQIPAYQEAADQLSYQLGRYTLLQAQYGSAIADQLSQLQDWYAQQSSDLSGNAQALAALGQIYQEKWADIVNGTQTGVNGVTDALTQLQQSIAQYLQGLQDNSSLSPLTPQQQLAAAQTNYDAELTKAQGGDQGALGDITKYADTFLTQARDAYASSTTYTDIFDEVTSQLGGLAGTLPTGQPGVVTSDPNAAIVAALPTDGSTLFSSADGTALGTQIATDVIAAISAWAGASSDDSAVVAAEVAQAKTAIVDAINTGLK
jgi:hypothetical protein